MKLYDVPPNSMVRVIDSESPPPEHRNFQKDEVLKFCHIDGMYSFCKDKDGNTVHLKAWAEVEIVEHINV